MSSEKIPPGGQRPPASTADAAQRLATIVDAAERAAAGVIDEAERQARQHLEEAQARADRIVAERLRELADRLDPPADTERRKPHLRRVELAPDVADDGDGDEPQLTQRRTGSAGARLLATQMAVSGARREEIEQRLRTGFEIDDTSEILDAILGPE